MTIQDRASKNRFALALAGIVLLLFFGPIVARGLGWEGIFEKEGYKAPERGQRALERLEGLQKLQNDGK